MTVEIKSDVAEIAKPADTQGEPEMLEYARRREAGEPVVTAEATEPDDNAASTDNAEATEGTEDGSKTTTEEATEGDGTTQTKPVEKSAKGKSKEGIQQRFDELTKQREEAKAEAARQQRNAEQARAEVDRLRVIAAEAQKAAIPTVVSAADDPQPVRANYDDPDEFTAALSAHTTRQEIRKAAAQSQAEANQRAQQAAQAAQEMEQQQYAAQVNAIHSTFTERQTKAMAELPDYDAKVVNNDQLVIEPLVFFAIEMQEMGPQILYHLAEHPEEAAELNRLHNTGHNNALIRLGELTAKVKAATKPRITKAAPVTKPVGSRSSPGSKSYDEMSMEEYAAARQQQLNASWERAHPRARRGR